MVAENPLYGGAAPTLLVRSQGTDWSLSPGPGYLVGRDPDSDIAISDGRISWQHAVLRFEDGRWVLADNDSTNGTYVDGQRVDRIDIIQECQVRLGNPADGALLTCTVSRADQSAWHGGPATQVAASPTVTSPVAAPGPVPPPPGPAVRTRRIGRAPDNDIVVADPAASRHHAELQIAAGACRIVDLDSNNGTYVNGQRVTIAYLADGDLISIGPATFRLSGQDLKELHAAEVAAVAATGLYPAPGSQAGQAPPAEPGSGAVAPASPPRAAESVTPPASAAADGGPLEIPYAVRWLVPDGERFANFDILNDNDSQLTYYREFGHIYAVGIPTKKWRLVVVSDPELLDEVAGNEEQFGKRVEEINFFRQLSNSRGAGISVIGDSESTEMIRRVMLPWYSPQHQRTQLERMKEQARKLVANWGQLPDDEPVDARTWMERYTLEVSGRGACNYNFGLLDGSGDPHPFAVAVPESTKESIARVAEPRPDFTLFASSARRAKVKRYRQHNTELVKTADALVRARMHTGPLGQQTDLLSRLVTTADPETGAFLDADIVRDQILMHLSNGFNGPSITGAWLAHVLGTNPDVEARLIAEIDGITGGDPDYDLQYDDLLKLTYTTQVIKETLRIYPPQPVTIRRSLKDGMLGRYRVRKNDIILVGTLAAQRDPRYWGPDADRFDPEQFAMDKVVDRPRHAFIPFSVGRRQCMAQEVTFMMLRVVLFEIYRYYRLRPAPGSTVRKNTVVTTKPAAVPVIRMLRDPGRRPPGLTELPDHPAAAAPGYPAAAPAAVAAAARPTGNDWGDPTEIPETSEFRHLVITYGSNFGANKELAERFAERSHFYGYSADVITLNELAAAPPRTQPWLLIVMTSTYTSNPPSNAAKFPAWLERTEPGAASWRHCRYLVWGLGNSQWNAFMAFPRYVHKKLAELGAVPLAGLAYGDVGSPVWERMHADWNGRIWPVLLELSGARPTAAAAARTAAERATAGALTSGNSIVAMRRSLSGDASAPLPGGRTTGTGAFSVMRLMGSGSRRRAESQGTLSRAMLAPTVMTNAVGLDTVEARTLACRELQAPGSPKRTRHLELRLPPDVAYRAGDHLGICPRNDEDRVERLVRHLGAVPDGLLMVPETMNVSVVPKGVVLQVRNVLTSLIDITGRPTVALVELLMEKAADPGERARLAGIKSVLSDPDGPASPLRAAIDAGGYDVVGLLDEFPSCSLNIFEFLQVAQQLRPRYYSTSSSPRIQGHGIAHLTVGLAATPVPGRPAFSGMCSRYMHALREGDRVNIFLNSADGFHLQEDVTKPMIFVSAGTGFAPMRAFLWERLALRRASDSLAEAALFNGIRSSSLDCIYQDELRQLAAEGVLNHVHIAESRAQPGHYVQDRIREQGALIWRLLAVGGYVYVCGSQPMRAAVRAAFTDVAAEHGSLSPAQAAAYLDKLETTAHYRPDLWG